MINTTYGQVRQAHAALSSLSREDLKVKFAVVLKWKRIAGVMRPLVEQLDELVNDLLKEYAVKDEDGKMVEGDRPGTVKIGDVYAYNEAITEILKTTVDVGCEQVEAADFGDGDTVVSSTLAQRLMELGPFFKE